MQQIILITTDEAMEEFFHKKIEELISPLKSFIIGSKSEPNNLDELLTVKEASKILGICSNTLLQFRKANKIKTVKVGRQVRIKRKSLNAFLTDH